MALSRIKRAGEMADLGPFTIPTQSLRDMLAADATKNGIVLNDSKDKFEAMHPQADGTHKGVIYTIGLYIAREPIEGAVVNTVDQGELAEVEAVQKAIDAYSTRGKERDAKAAEEKAEHRKAIDTAFKLGKEVGTETIAAASQLANTIASLQAHGVRVG